MIIKKFQAKTEQEAIEQAKKELGSNIVVMNVKDVKRKGIFRLFKPHLTEVTVALEDDAEKTKKSFFPAETEKKPIAVPAAAAEEKKPDSVPAKAQDILPNDSEETGRAIEEKLDSLQSLIEQNMQKPEEEKKESAEESNETVAFMKLLYNTMLENEVNEKYANQIIDEIEKNNKVNAPIDSILASIYQKTILKFGKPMEIEPAEKGPKVVFFVGPTGVGKTTTIAKIASKFRVDEKKKIALLTADTYRIAAAEQLHTYANILEVPFVIIYTVEEVEAALQEFSEFDYILVDTAGHSHHNESQKETMSQFIHSVDGKAEKEVFLVVSATTKYRDLISIADTYKDMTEYKLIFTKLDETTTLGNLLNLKLHTGASLSYATYGQNVPDDIEIFNPQKTVKQLLGGKR